jgi:hypothetical protein
MKNLSVLIRKSVMTNLVVVMINVLRNVKDARAPRAIKVIKVTLENAEKKVTRAVKETQVPRETKAIKVTAEKKVTRETREIKEIKATVVSKA